MEAIETDRLVLRNFRSGDCEALREMILQYQASEVAAYDHQWPTDPAAFPGIVEWFASGDSYLAVCLRDTGRFIGLVCLNGDTREGWRGYDLGFIFNFDYHGQGYASEACRVALRRAFIDLKADRVTAGTARENRASCRLLARLGFSEDPGTVGCFTLTREAWAAGGG